MLGIPLLGAEEGLAPVVPVLLHVGCLALEMALRYDFSRSCCRVLILRFAS
jgi:hypothetical protein